jgi:hypothetical protein
MRFMVTRQKMKYTSTQIITHMRNENKYGRNLFVEKRNTFIFDGILFGCSYLTDQHVVYLNSKKINK